MEQPLVALQPLPVVKLNVLPELSGKADNSILDGWDRPIVFQYEEGIVRLTSLGNKKKKKHITSCFVLRTIEGEWVDESILTTSCEDPVRDIDPCD